MTPKYFFDYLCGLGFATQRAVPVRTNRPVYQNQNSFQQKGTEFFGEATEYTVKIPEVVRDAIRGSGSPQEIYVLKDNKETILLNKIGEFFSLLHDLFSGAAGVSNRSAGGLRLTGGLGRDSIKDYADHPDPESVDIELLLYASQNFLKGYYNNPLHLAMTLNLAKDILSIAKEEEEKKKREELGKVEQDIKALMGELGKQKEDIVKKPEKDKALDPARSKTNKNNEYRGPIVKREDAGKVFLESDPSFLPSTVPSWEKILDTITYIIPANHSAYRLTEDGDTVYMYWQGGPMKVGASIVTESGNYYKHKRLNIIYNKPKRELKFDY